MGSHVRMDRNTWSPGASSCFGFAFAGAVARFDIVQDGSYRTGQDSPAWTTYAKEPAMPAPEAPDTTIQVEQLSKEYPGGVRALDDVSFTVDRGEILGYLGRNGAGKTTTVRILATLTRKTSGRAVVRGVDIERDPASIRRVVGVAMQNASLDDLMSGREHLELAASLDGMPRREAKDRAGELLDAFGLQPAAD